MILDTIEHAEMRMAAKRDPVLRRLLDAYDAALELVDEADKEERRDAYVRGWRDACEACAERVPYYSEERCLALKDDYEEGAWL